MGEQLNAGLELMIIGMGIVFVFLAMLVAFVTLMSLLLATFFPEDDTITSNVSGITSASQSQEEDDIIAAISAAVHRYREEKPS